MASKLTIAQWLVANRVNPEANKKAYEQGVIKQKRSAEDKKREIKKQTRNSKKLRRRIDWRRRKFALHMVDVIMRMKESNLSYRNISHLTGVPIGTLMVIVNDERFFHLTQEDITTFVQINDVRTIPLF